MSPLSAQYLPVAQGDPHESSRKPLAQLMDIDDNGVCACHCHSSAGFRLWLLHAFLLFLNLTVFVSLLFYSHLPERTNWDDLLDAHSPVYPAIEYSLVRFNGTIGFCSPYVGVGPKVDAAWAEITDNTGSLPIHIPDKFLYRLGLDDNHWPSNV
ncbi:uncharacterized protein FIBRA_08632 [Fibroporia radiculosa]|uniref:Uncharacterized protein n=1 Tax=Fibroporia radiculosa TaxID=599839 RepID=J4H5A0_9APHY|nr:uncharacterized protein FIBRA_08632 [Fibroporia radiculosa]CCM06374.1 predicted protein [Fibroporia radiculosa]